MSLALLLDKDTQAKSLISLLKVAGHNVLTANDIDIADFLIKECLILPDRVTEPF